MSILEFRPKQVDHLFGQQHLWPLLTQWQANVALIPKAILLTGPFGNGKTSIARMIASWIATNEMNIVEMNSAEARGIDEIRDLTETAKFLPVGGGGRVYILDEVHGLTKDAQNALLKVLEEPPKHAYFILCSTDPQKIIPTVKSRCKQLTVKVLDKQTSDQFANWIAQWWFQKDFSTEVLDMIYSRTLGHARDLVHLVAMLGQGGNFDKPDALPVDWGTGKAIAVLDAAIKGDPSKLVELIANAEPNIYAIDNFIDQMAMDVKSPVFKAYAEILTMRSNRKLYLISAQEFVLGTLSACYNQVR